jgi:D-sedoheptulose 7-phosphate isomerase
MIAPAAAPGTRASDALLRRNCLAAEFFALAANDIATTARAMAERFQRGGRLLAFGRGASVSDAQHVAVEFVHPVIVGKRALPAVDVSAFPPASIASLLRPDDMLLGVLLPGHEADVALALRANAEGGVLIVSPLGGERTIALERATNDPFILQEWAETWYHTLWETVHVYLERQTRGDDVGSAGFLYPFLGTTAQESDSLHDEVVASIHAKVADDAALRTAVAGEQSGRIAAAAERIAERVQTGGTMLVFGNGGSATDANDLAFDCTSPPRGFRPIPALSLASDAATITAVANDVGNELIFVRQLNAHAREGDIAFGISTSGGSRNVIAALGEARKRGLLTVALLGYDGGEIARQGLADIAIVVGSDYIPRIQEVQASVYHVLRNLLDRCLDRDD